METIRLDNPEYLVLLGILPLLFLVFLFGQYLKGRALKRFGNPGTVSRLMPWYSFRRPWIRFAIFIIGIGCVSMAAVNPKVGSRLEEATREGVDIMIALDVSRSMLAEDIRPNRLERAKSAVSRIIDRLEHDRVGLVVFAGNAITQVPLTSDHSAAKMMLRPVNTESVSVQGTAIGTAIERAMASFPDQEEKNRVLIIISDGENHLDDPVEKARLARQNGIIIHTVGIGSSEGAPIPVYQDNRLTGYLRDASGNTVITRYDEATLKAIADAGGGTFQHGRGADMGLNRIVDEIRKMEQQEYEAMIFTEYESRYHYFVALALLFLLLEILIFERKNKWLEKIKLFG